MATIHGEEIGLLGIQVDFAPVMDVNNNASNPVIGSN
jgi:beta-N-acetylhexosaminidase